MKRKFERILDLPPTPRRRHPHHHQNIPRYESVILWILKISILISPKEGCWKNSRGKGGLGGGGVGLSKVYIIKGKYESNLEVTGRFSIKIFLCGGRRGIDIIWNNTFLSAQVVIVLFWLDFLQPDGKPALSSSESSSSGRKSPSRSSPSVKTPVGE